jgi:hypothetical protein
MKTVYILLVALGGAAVALGAPPVAAGPAPHKKAEELVRQLASPRYKERERAATALIMLGRAARPALVAGKTSSDAVVQTRCEQLLPQALALDLLVRVRRFQNDPEGQLEHDLPLWRQFREQVGTDDSARQLYTEMVQANAPLLELVDEEPSRVTTRVQQRYQEMYQELFGSAIGGGFRGGFRPGAMNPAELCAVLFVAASPAYKPTQPDWMLAELYAQPAFTTPLKDSKKGIAYRQLFFRYLDARMDDNTINQCVWMLTQHRIKEGADVLARAIRAGKARQVYTKASALCCVGTLGTPEHISALAPFLKDDSQVQPFFVGRGQRGAVQVRDVALAMSVHLSGKNPKDYGFALWNVYPNQMIQYHQLGFGTDEERTRAFRKWNEDSPKTDHPRK